jgi:hypothetical protein
MIARIITALATLLTCTTVLAVSTADAVLGRWSDGKNALTFRRDGTVIKRPMGTPGHAGAPVRLKYRIDGNRVVITDSAGQQLVHQLRGEVLLGPAGEQFKPSDHLVALFGFTMASDGSRRDIKFIRCQDPMDLHVVKGALTEKEKFEGIRLMAQRKHPIPQQEVGKTRYDYILFDNRTRSYTQ